MKHSLTFVKREITVSSLWHAFLSRILRISYHRYHYLRLDIDIDKTNKLLDGFDIPIKELTYEDFLKGDPTVFCGKKLAIYRQRCLDPTYKAYGIFENGRLVYSAWISLHRLGMSEETKPVFLADNEGYLEDAYCDPVARGRGFHTIVNNFRVKKIFEAGKTKVIAIVQEGNDPAFKTQFKSGFVDLGTFYHGRIFGIKFNTLKKEIFDVL